MEDSRRRLAAVYQGNHRKFRFAIVAGGFEQGGFDFQAVNDLYL
jgi:hypothetical protein